MPWSKLIRKVRRAVLRDEPSYYDMFENRGERYFARLYLKEIIQWIQSEKLQGPLKILDAGCQTGRLSIPLSQMGHQVTGVDTSSLALRRAWCHARERGTQARWIWGDLRRWLPAQPEGSFDLVLCTEVLYLRSNYRQLLAGLLRLLRPGGLFFISHRPLGYYLKEAHERQDTQALQLLKTAREGILWGNYYNWQTRQELLRLYSEMEKAQVLSIASIGFLSWLAINPEELDAQGQELLFQLETTPRLLTQESGRYLLVSGRKRP